MMEDPLIKTHIRHCRLCAKQEYYSKLLDLQADTKTFIEYKLIFEYLRIDYLDLSETNKLPKTICGKCCHAIKQAYTFFKNVEWSQSLLNTLYNQEVTKKKPEEPTFKDCFGMYCLTNTDAAKNYSLTNTDVAKNYCLTNTEVARNYCSTNTEVARNYCSTNTEVSSNYCSTNTDVARNYCSTNLDLAKSSTRLWHCRFCAKQDNYKDLLDLTHDEDMLKKCLEILHFFKIYYIDLSRTKLPKTYCQACYTTLQYAYAYFQDIKKCQDSLKRIYTSSESNEKKSESSSSEPEASASYVLHGMDLQKNEQESNYITVIDTDENESWSDYRWLCCHCDIVCKSMDELRVHSKDKHNMCYAYKCADCEARFRNFYDFVQHVLKHRNGLRFYCQYCNTKFPTIAECSEHVHSHYDGKQCICRLCGELLPYPNVLELHLQLYGHSVSIEERRTESWADYTWTCQVCKVQTPDVDSLRTHTQIYHNKCFAMKCADCPRVLKNYTIFVAHVRGHRAYLSNYCSYCNEYFEDVTRLNKHMTKHTASDQKLCSNCGQVFTVLSKFDRHKKLFCIEKPVIIKQRKRKYQRKGAKANN